MSRKIGKAIAWSAVGTWGTQATSLCFFLILSRTLGPHLYGLAAVISLFLTVSQALLVDGFSTIILRAESLDHDLTNLVFWIQLGLGALFSALIVSCSDFAAHYYREPVIRPLMWLAGSIPLVQALQSVPVELTKREMRFQRLAIRSFVGAATSGVVGVVLAVAGAGVWALIVMQVVQAIVQATILWRGIRWRPTLNLSPPLIRKYMSTLQFGGAALLGRALNLFDTQIPRAVMTIVFGVLTAGYYNFGTRLTEVIAIIALVPVQQVSGAVFSAQRGDQTEMSKAVTLLLGVASILTLPALAGMFIISPTLVPLLFGPKWLSAVPYLETVLVLLLVAPVSYVVTDLVIITGHLGARRLTHGVSIVTGLLIAALAFRLGPLGAAWAFAARSLALTPLFFWAAKRATEVSYLELFKALGPAVVGSAIMVASCELYTLCVGEIAPTWRLAEQIIFSVLIYSSVQAVLFKANTSALLRLFTPRKQAIVVSS